MSVDLRALIERYDRPGPRYTGYPMPPVWKPLPPSAPTAALARARARAKDPLSIYVHIPFCARKCSYCGCHAIASPHYTPVEAFLQALVAEARLWRSAYGVERKAIQMHWGGGTPTFLKSPELIRLFESVTGAFPLAEGAEVALEADPTTLTFEQLQTLRSLGFNRISLGVQDLDDEVQRLIGRHQSWEQSLQAARWVRELGFPGLNIDLVYGLPGQSQESFSKTLEGVLELSPNRLAIYGFAYLPSLLHHQKRISADRLPNPELRLELLLSASERLEKAGYVAVGMDHFARPDDELAKAVNDGRIIRNFMGYAVKSGSDSIGLGPSAISDMGNSYLQNEKKLIAWERAVMSGQFAIQKGHARSQDDEMRKWIIHRLMGTFALRWEDLRTEWGVGPEAFADAIESLRQEEPWGVVEIKDTGIFVTDLGKRFVRNLVFPFDAYLKGMGKDTRFSRTV